MSEVIVVIGSGSIGQAIARRVGVGKQIVLADLRKENAEAAAEVLGNAGYDVTVTTVDVSSREDVQALAASASQLGVVTRFDPRRRCLSVAGIAGDHPRGRLVRHGARARRVRQCHRCGRRRAW